MHTIFLLFFLLLQLFELSYQLNHLIPNVTCGLFDFDLKMLFAVSTPQLEISVQKWILSWHHICIKLKLISSY